MSLYSDRRSILIGLASLALLPIAGWPFNSAIALAAPPLARRLSDLARHDVSARRVGATYLRTTAHESMPERLVELICGGPEHIARWNAATPDQLRRMISVAIRDDFAHGRTVHVEGWVLSQTEARISALAALRASHA